MNRTAPTTRSNLAHLQFPVQFLDTFEALARCRQIPASQFWQEGPFRFAAHAPSQGTMSGDQVIQLLDQAQRYADPALPLSAQLLEHMPLASFGTLGIVLMTSANLEAALEAALRFYPLVMPACRIERRDRPQHVDLVLELSEDFGAHNDTLNEVLLGALNRIRRHLQPQIGLLEIHCRHRNHFPLQAYQSFADPQRLHFQQSSNHLTLPRRYLQLAFENANRSTMLQFRQTLEEQIRSLRQHVSLAQSVRDCLRERLKKGQSLDIDSIAPLMTMSTRSLSRHLAEEQCRYRELVSEARMAHARHLLASSNRTISQVAHAAGFRNDSSFCRAFRAHQHCSPRQYRQRHSGQHGAGTTNEGREEE